MSCLGGRLVDLVDGRLAPSTAEQVMAHVARCEPCRDELVELRQLRSLLAGASTPDADAALVRRLSHLPSSTSLPTFAPAAGSRGFGSRRVRRTAAAAGGATAVAAMLAWGAATTVGSVTPPAAPLQLVVPSVDRYGIEHAASVDSFPLAAPGSAVVLMSYGGSGAVPVTTAPAAVRHLLP